MAKMVKTAIDARVKAGALKPREGVDLLNYYEEMMREYTYIERGPSPVSAPPQENGAAAPAAEQNGAAPVSGPVSSPTPSN